MYLVFTCRATHVFVVVLLYTVCIEKYISMLYNSYFMRRLRSTCFILV